MKTNHYLLTTAVMLLVSLIDASAQSMRLKEIKTDSNDDRTYFNYNEKNQLDSIYCEWVEDGVNCHVSYRLLKYSEEGKLLKDLRFSKFTTVFVPTDSVDYFYDEEGRLYEQEFYTRVQDENGDMVFKLNIKKSYRYDKQGRLDRIWVKDIKHISEDEKIFFKYDEHNRIASKKSQFAMTEYEYNKDGMISSVLDYIKVESGEYYKSMLTTYEYDENKNLVKRTIKDLLRNTIKEKYEITYDTSLLAEYIQYPVTPIDDNDLYTLSYNGIKSAKKWSYHLLDFGLGYDYEAEYIYENCIGAGIENVNNMVNASYFDVTENKIFIHGTDSAVKVLIYNMDGTVVLSELCHGQLDISSLPSGTYIISACGTYKKIAR